MTYPVPFVFPIEQGRALLVMSCSSTKRAIAAGEAARFADLYDGPTWRQVRASRFPLTNVAAISALYGFLEPGAPIETYDRKMDDKTALRISTTGDHVWRLEQATRQAGSAFIVGGELYRQLGEAMLRKAPDLVDRVTFASGSYLAQRKQLGAWLRDQAALFAGAGELEAAA
jgi:hypothetical protein